jgi:hypothetical protein
MPKIIANMIPAMMPLRSELLVDTLGAEIGVTAVTPVRPGFAFKSAKNVALFWYW